MKIKITVTTGSTAVVSAITFDPVPPTSTAPASRVFAQTGSLGRLLGSMPDGTPINLQYHTDAHGNVTALSDAYGNLSTAYYTDAWGNVIAGSSAQNPYVNVGNHGYWQDADLGLNYVRARWLNPETGTWLSVDPVQGEPRYNYAHNSPTVRVDPSGMAPESFDDKLRREVYDPSQWPAVRYAALELYRSRHHGEYPEPVPVKSARPHKPVRNAASGNKAPTPPVHNQPGLPPPPSGGQHPDRLRAGNVNPHQQPAPAPRQRATAGQYQQMLALRAEGEADIRSAGWQGAGEALHRIHPWTVAMSAGKTIGKGLLVIGGTGFLVGAGVISAPFAAFAFAAGAVYFTAKSIEAHLDSVSRVPFAQNIGRNSVLAGAGDMLGITQDYEIATGREALTGNTLSDEQYSDVIGQGIGIIGTGATARYMLAGGINLGSKMGRWSAASDRFQWLGPEQIPSISRPSGRNPLVTGTYRTPAGLLVSGNPFVKLLPGVRRWLNAPPGTTGLGEAIAIENGETVYVPVVGQRPPGGSFYHLMRHWFEYATRQSAHGQFSVPSRFWAYLIDDALRKGFALNHLLPAAKQVPVPSHLDFGSVGEPPPGVPRTEAVLIDRKGYRVRIVMQAEGSDPYGQQWGSPSDTPTRARIENLAEKSGRVTGHYGDKLYQYILIIDMKTGETRLVTSFPRR